MHASSDDSSFYDEDSSETETGSEDETEKFIYNFIIPLCGSRHSDNLGPNRAFLRITYFWAKTLMTYIDTGSWTSVSLRQFASLFVKVSK